MELYYRNVGLLGLLVFSVIAIWLMLRVQHLDERPPNIIIIQADDLVIKCCILRIVCLKKDAGKFVDLLNFIFIFIVISVWMKFKSVLEQF